ncbi:hypothetical protein TeGR_g8771 [Tetraparma gracilis]|uniref:RanBP2-type domain-containing protein n=1 Tax=Tetraparma gracilis TaxID=2962635 RepID=A0ABQ6MZI4_9STRA|nr:hypothetical protein TeGR_g8771 [Tetraparma gracilis]
MSVDSILNMLDKERSESCPAPPLRRVKKTLSPGPDDLLNLLQEEREQLDTDGILEQVLHVEEANKGSKQWECPNAACAALNRAKRGTCVDCGAARPSRGEQWECPNEACGELNRRSSAKCARCGTKRSLGPSEPKKSLDPDAILEMLTLKEAGEGEGGEGQGGKQWVCPKPECAALNRAKRDSCVECGGGKQLQEERAQPATLSALSPPNGKQLQEERAQPATLSTLSPNATQFPPPPSPPLPPPPVVPQFAPPPVHSPFQPYQYAQHMQQHMQQQHMQQHMQQQHMQQQPQQQPALLELVKALENNMGVPQPSPGSIAERITRLKRDAGC